MRYRAARQLHTGDEVRIKRTGVVCRVVDTEAIPRDGAIPPRILVCVTGAEGAGLSVFSHYSIS